MMLTCTKCGQAYHISAKSKANAGSYVCPVCERKKKKGVNK